MDEYTQRLKTWEHHTNLLQIEDKRILKEALNRICPECGHGDNIPLDGLQ